MVESGRNFQIKILLKGKVRFQTNLLLFDPTKLYFHRLNCTLLIYFRHETPIFNCTSILKQFIGVVQQLKDLFFDKKSNRFGI